MTRRVLRAIVLVVSLGFLGTPLTACTPGLRVPASPRSAPAPLRPTLAEGDRLRRAGREEQALELYERAIQRDPECVPAHLRYVSTLAALGRRSEARRVYRDRAAQPGAGEVDRTLARRLETDGSSSQLRRVYALAAERSPAQVWWRLALVEIEIAEAEAWNRRRADAIERGDKDAEREAFAQANAALVRGGDQLDLAAPKAGAPAEVDLYRGHLRAVEGDILAGAVASAAAYRAAELAFHRATARDPDLVEAWEGLGEVRLRVGDLRGSLVAYTEAARLAPADAHLRTSIGVVLQRVERRREAAEQFQQAAVLAPHDADPWLRLGDARADDDRWDEALVAYDEALRRDATAVEAHYKKATVYEHLGRLGEARAAYERYESQGGERASLVRRRIERLLRAQDAGGKR